MSAASKLPQEILLGEVDIVVRDLPNVSKFYMDLLKLRGRSSDQQIILYHPGRPEIPLVILRQDPKAKDPHPRAPGLYHTAFRLQARRELAKALARMATLGIHLDGVADHLVSEALYLHDPERNGIEIYADRPKHKWPREGLLIQMDTLPLDLDGLLAELRSTDGDNELVEVGHIHLKVSDLSSAEAFYSGLLGFQVKLRWHGALFVAAGDYHHHLGLNVWHSLDGGRLDPASAGLRGFTVFLPSKSEWQELVAAVAAAPGLHIDGDTASLLDPSGITVRIKPVPLGTAIT